MCAWYLVRFNSEEITLGPQVLQFRDVENNLVIIIQSH